MKLQIDTEAKTVAMEGEVQVATVFNYLMSWFPEEWEQWKFIPFKPTIKYEKIIVEKEVVKDPYWNPFNNKGINGTLSGTMLTTGGNTFGTFANSTTSTQVELDFNNTTL